MLTDNTRKYLLGFKDYMTKSKYAFCYRTVPDSRKCLRAPVKKREMDWQLVASYFTVKSTDIFCSVGFMTV